MDMLPNWHPSLVHFTIALTLSAAGLFLASFLLRTRAVATQLTSAARWNLWLAAASAVPSVAAGLQAYYSVAHDPAAHAAMTVHMKWAFGTLALLLMSAGLAWRERSRGVGTTAALGVAMLLASGALAVTGYLGAENVYRHGLGVMRLPQAEGPGHDHAHEGAEPAAAVVDATTQPHDAGAHSHDPKALSHTAQDPAVAVDAFSKALSAEDFATVQALLDPNVRIFESGGVESSAEEYASHHMKADAAFLKSMSVTQSSRTGDAVGDLAWVGSEQRIKGSSGGISVDIASKETMVLRKTAAGWRIIHIHWSSRPFKA